MSSNSNAEGICIVVKAIEGSPTVEVHGSCVDDIDDKEAEKFGINDYTKKIAAEAQPKWVKDISNSIHIPKWSVDPIWPVPRYRRTLYPREARILGVRYEPVIVTSQEFSNNSDVTARYNAGITQEVQDTVSSSWSKGVELSASQEITYKIFKTVEGTTSFEYKYSWGEEYSKSKTVTVGSSSGVEVELAPGQAVRAVLTATRGTMDIQVDYSASLKGHVIHRSYYKNFFGFSVESTRTLLNVKEIQKANGLKETVDSTELMTIGFYSDAKVTVNNVTSK